MTKIINDDVSDIFLEKKLNDMCLNMGISSNMTGCNFLKDGIKKAVKEPRYCTNLNKLLYPYIAEKNGVEVVKVERGIRTVLDKAYNSGKIMRINDILGVKIFEKKQRPTNSQFIAAITDYLITYMKIHNMIEFD